MGKQTPLYSTHLAHGARVVDFAGWEMPLHYGSQLEEHHAVRRTAGMFDVSHMAVVDLHGADVRPYLRHLLANDVARLTQTGKALYGCMLNETGGVIDDLIVYYLAENWFRAVVNAGTRDKDLAWMRIQRGGYNVDIRERVDLAMIAVQGPQARSKVLGLLEPGLRAQAENLAPFFAAHDDTLFIGRTGYTGEDGFELIVPGIEAAHYWQRLADVGVQPTGLGARDTLRLEAGMNLYGQDMDETITPWESGLGWTVVMNAPGRTFIGESALAAQKTAGVANKLVGLVLEDKGVLRAHQRVETTAGPGEITSGGFAPTLNLSIALARVPSSVQGGCHVDLRGRMASARIVKYPFVRNGKSCLT